MTENLELERVSVSSGSVELDMRGVSKSFPGVLALSDVDFEARAGEVHALVGENGSGKSTLIKVASGVLQSDQGSVVIGSESLDDGGVPRARRLGLITAYQDTSLVLDLSVADNITLSFNAIGQEKPADIDQILARFDLPFRRTDIVANLGPGARQLLEVARAMAHQPRVLMLDEPTAALDLRLAGKLEEIIKRARDDGTSIVYVSHRLDEIKRLADRLTVLRDGVVQGSYSSGGWQIDDIVEMMVGRPTELEFPTRRRAPGGDARLVARDLSGLAFGPVSLEVRAGEIIGVAGAEGNGQRALLRGIIGIDRTAGETSVDGKTSRHVNPATALSAGISFQSGDRAAESTFGPVSVMGNATAQLGPASGPLGLALGGRLVSAFMQAKKELGIMAASPYQPISGLSGGNQQKTVLARPALRTPKVLILDEPTQGVDARARLDIYKVIADAADEGIGVLVNSSDSSELAGLCDRVYVMSRGKVVKELQGPTTENEIVRSFVAATTVIEELARSADEKSTLFQRTRARLATHLPIAVLIVLITATMIYAGIKSPVFFSSVNMTNLLVLTLPLAFVALGQQFVMIGGLLDLSVGSTMSLTVVMLSVTLPDFALSSIGLTLVVLALIVLVVGGFNVLLIEVLKINPIVATIATMGIVQGVAILIRPQVGGVIATDLVDLVSKGIGFVPFGFMGLIALCIYMEYYLYRRPRGLALRGLGFNMESCYRLGERVTRLRAISLSVAAFGAVVGGVFLASQTGMGANDVGAGYSLPVFAAVFLGGAVMSGGRGSFVGAVLGALFLSLINNVTPLLGIPAASQDLIYGAILILAISVYATVNRSRGRQRT